MSTYQKLKIKTERTGRCFTLGDSSNEHVWMVFHGYGMTADKMITKFSNLSHCYIVAPEGLSRFYWKGFDGPVVASWMTREDREDEIIDQKVYLNRVVESLQLQGKKINLLGFSQGVSTMLRWIGDSNIIPGKIILWAGDIPSDVNYQEGKYNDLFYHFVLGTKDEMVTMSMVELRLEALKLQGLTFQLHTFDGGHDLHEETITQLFTL